MGLHLKTTHTNQQMMWTECKHLAALLNPLTSFLLASCALDDALEGQSIYLSFYSRGYFSENLISVLCVTRRWFFSIFHDSKSSPLSPFYNPNNYSWNGFKIKLDFSIRRLSGAFDLFDCRLYEVTIFFLLLLSTVKTLRWIDFLFNPPSSLSAFTVSVCSGVFHEQGNAIEALVVLSMC